jgi:sugar phosphate isomerase/epimerase
MTARVGVQLYTVREQCERDLEGTLDTIGELGYDGVELYGLHGRQANELRRLLEQRGLAIAGRHAGLDLLEERLGELAAEQRALGCDRLALSWIDPPEDAADADEATRRIEAIAVRATAAGLRFGFHNHWGELARLDDGSTLLERLFAIPSELLWLELDLGWAWEAGAEPLELLERARGRSPLVHVKDLRARGTREHCPVGEGGVGYAEIVPKAVELGVEWLIVEQDELDRPAAEALERSLAAVQDAIGAVA